MDNPDENFRSKFNKETRMAFIIERTGLGAGTIQKLDGYGMPESISGELSYILNNILAPKGVALLKSMYEERLDFIEHHPDEVPWEVHDQKKHLKKIVDETGLEVENINRYYSAIFEWMSFLIIEVRKIAGQKE